MVEEVSSDQEESKRVDIFELGSEKVQSPAEKAVLEESEKLVQSALKPSISSSFGQ